MAARARRFSDQYADQHQREVCWRPKESGLLCSAGSPRKFCRRTAGIRSCGATSRSLAGRFAGYGGNPVDILPSPAGNVAPHPKPSKGGEGGRRTWRDDGESERIGLRSFWRFRRLRTGVATRRVPSFPQPREGGSGYRSPRVGGAELGDRCPGAEATRRGAHDHPSHFAAAHLKCG